MKIPSPGGGPHASRKRFPWSAPITSPAGREHALLARGLPLIIIIMIIALAALVMSSVGHAQSLDPVLVSNTGQTAGSDLATATGRVSYAQSFTTGDHPDGYFLSSVDVGLKAGSGVTAEVALWWSGRWTSDQPIGFFSLPDHILTTLSGVPDIDNDASTLERFSANDVLLLPATTYWIVVTRTGGADDGLSVATTSSEAAVDAGGMAGFSVGNNVWVPTSSLDPDAPEWDDYSGSVDASMKIGLRGSEATRPPGPYATNRNQQSRAAAAETSSSTSKYATSFTTASNPTTHQLTSVLLGVAAEAGVSPRVAIHADASGGQPAASALTNGTLTAPADVSRVLGAPDRAEFTASPAISLAGSTRYWVVLDVGSGSGSLSVSTTAANANDEDPQPQWSIDSTMKAYNGSSWSNDSLGRSFRMALNGPTDQYTGPPFQLMREVRIGLPQVGLGVAAEIHDESLRVKNATWQWQRGETSDGTFTDIPAAQGGTSRVYVPAAADLGKWLKALASYENAFGPGKMVSGVSGQAVFSQPIMSNAGQISSIGYIVLQNDTVNIAQAFTTGGNPSGYSLRGLRFGIYLETDIDALSWALYADAAGEPAAAPLFTEIAVPSESLDANSRTFEDLVHPGFPLAPDTKYWAVLTSSPLMEGTGGPTLGAAGISEWGERVILDGPAAELDPGSESGWTLHFSTLSTPHDPLSTEEWVTFTKALELEVNGKMALRMSVLTHPEVTASFGQESHTVAEGGTQSVTVTLSADPERTVTIPIVTMGQDGASSVDYSGVPDSVTFNAGGPTEMTFTFTAVQDTVDDEGESVLLGFGSDLLGGVSAGTPDETTLTITDDDPPEVSFGESAYMVAEGGMVSVEVKLTSALGSAVTVPVTHTPQSATSSTDYSGVPANVMFSAGETSKAFTFTATQDTVDDDGESVLLAFGTLPATVQTGTTTQTTVTITDDDPPEVSFGQSAYTVAEGGTVSVEVKLTSALASAVTVPVTHTPQSATSSGDYSGVPANVMFSAGETSKAFTFTATQDTADDDGESVLLAFGTLPATVQTGTTTQTTVTITDDDDPQVSVSFGATSYSVAEGSTVTVRVTLSADPKRSVTIPIITMNEEGASSADYSGVPANVIFASGETEQTITFSATQDDVDDDGESVKLAFGTPPPRVSAGTPGETTVTITDDDIPSSVEVSFGSAAYTVTEGGTVDVTVILDDDPEQTVTVPIGTINEGGASGSDYSGVPATVTFSSGETEQTFTVTATEDNLDDGGERVKLSFVNLPPEATIGMTSEATVTIINTAAQNSLTVAFQSVAYSVSEGDSVVVTVILSAVPGSEVTVPLTVTEQGGASSEDYSGVPASVTFGPDERDQTFTVSATQDVVDDDEESVVIGFGTLSDGVSEGGVENTTVDIRDDDDPAVVVSFGSATYTVTEGDTVDVTVTLDRDSERTVTIPIVTTEQDGASSVDYSGVPDSVTFNAGGPTEMTFTFTATQDTVDDEGESVLLGFGSDLSGGVSAGTPDETTLTITDDDPPEVSFGESAYMVAEGGMVSVEVKLTSALGSAVTVPVTHTPQSATSSTDYSGVPANVMFSAGETSKAFTFTATQDTADDDGESVLLTFGTLPATVQTGTTTQTTVNITDDDDAPAGKVTLELTPATINESGTGNASTVTASVPSASSAATTVTVSVNPTDTTTLTGNTTLSIPAGDTNSTGVVTITAVNDDAYTGNRTVAVSGTAVNSVGITDPDDVTLTITDDDIPVGCESGDIWCGTVGYTDRFPSDAAGRKPLRWYHLDSDVPEFAHNGFTYKVYTSSLGANPGGGTYVMPPFHIPERSTARIGLGNLSATDPMGYWEMPPNQDYLDWTLYISTNQGGATLEAKLPFNEAKFCCGHKWRWYGLDLYELNEAWAAGKEYKLRIVEDPRADRTSEVLGPPLYLEALGVNRGSALVRWVRPQVRNDGAPPGVSYKVQWKAAAGEWDTPAVSEHVYVPLPGKEVLSWRISGLTPGSAYDVRVIAVNEAGDSAPSNVLRVNTDQAFLTSQNQAANSPATGGPGITGRALAGETLTATTSGIEDEDGLADAVFAYQWIRQDLATLNDTDIEGAISSTYTVTAADDGKAIQVRVTFTDDAGNPESVTSDAMAVAVGLRLGSATLDGARLTLTYNDTLDTFVTLPPAAFTVSVNGGSRSVNAVSVAGASVTLTLASAAQAGDTVTVDYAKPNGPDFIRDTQGRVAASFSGRAVSNDTPPPALTAAIHGAPESHDGQEDFTFELRFSEAPKTGFSDETLQGDAFRVTGGEVVGARQLDPPGKVSWEISVSPASSGDVNVVLPVSEDCDADGAICTDDGTMLSSPLEFTVSGPTSQQTSQQRQENTAATGSPTISGTVQVGQILAASTTGITDPDGTTNASYSYQWIANDGTSDSDIADATVSTYTLVAGDAGKMIKARVTFTDDGGNEETLTSVATVAVAPTVPGAPGILSVSVNDTGKLDVSWDAPDSNGGSAVTGYKVRWKESSDSWDTPAEVSETTVTGTSHTVTGLTDGVEYTFRVFAVNSAGDGSASEEESGTPRETTAPTVSSATVDGATLTLTFSEGLTETPLPAVTTFTVNVGDNRRGVNSVAISGSTVTLTLASAVTSTDAVTVVYTVPSDAAAARLKDLSANPAESFTGQAVTNNTAAAQPLLTASIHDEPSSHDGQSEFTFELQFSEEPKEDFSYKTLRDHAFTVTRGTVKGSKVDGARRLVSGSNIGWLIKIRPTSNGDVTIVLPITEDCDAQGAICTGDGDGRPLSNRLEITVSGPTG